VHYSRVTSLFGAINSLIVQFASFQYLGRKKGKKVRFLFHSRDPEGTISSSWIPFIAYSQQADKQEISSSLSLSLSLFLSPPAQNNRFDRKKPSTASYSIVYWASSLPNELRTSVLLASDASDESRTLATKWKQSFLLESAGRYNNVDVMHSVCCRSHISKA